MNSTNIRRGVNFYDFYDPRHFTLMMEIHALLHTHPLDLIALVVDLVSFV